MLKNYLKIAVRNLSRHPAYSFLNISGLAIGMAASILILLWGQNELSYDRFNANADHIYRITVVASDVLGSAVTEVKCRVSGNSLREHETRLDDADVALLDRFRDPPLPGLELLLQFFGLAA